jgi:hypothetical protein
MILWIAIVRYVIEAPRVSSATITNARIAPYNTANASSHQGLTIDNKSIVEQLALPQLQSSQLRSH